MIEITVITTDQTFLKDLNSAGIEGVRAEYRPEMAFDTTEQILTIVVSAAASTGLTLVADWILARLNNSPTPTQLNINNQTVNAENVVAVINNYIDTQAKPKPVSDSDSRATSPYSPPYLQYGLGLTAALLVAHTVLAYGYANDAPSLTAFASVLASFGSTSAFVWLAIAAWYQSHVLSDQARAIRAQTDTVKLHTRALELEEKHKDLNYTAAVLPFIYSRLDRLASELSQHIASSSDNGSSPNIYGFEDAATVTSLMRNDAFKAGLHASYNSNRLIQRTAGGYIALYDSTKSSLLAKQRDSVEKTFLIECMFVNTVYEDLYSDLSRLRRLSEDSQPFI